MSPPSNSSIVKSDNELTMIVDQNTPVLHVDIAAVFKPCQQQHQPVCSIPYLDTLMVALNLLDEYYNDGDTVSLSSTDSGVEDVRKSVRFGAVETREYSIVKGDLLACRDGLPLSLDWDYRTLERVQIEELEELDEREVEDFSLDSDDTHQVANSKPRKLSYLDRRLILEQVGYKVEDCFGDVRSSVWIGVDEELPPVDNEI